MTMHRTCDGNSRRDFLRAGVLGASGFSLSNYLKLAQAGEIAATRGKAAIFINLGGGPSHIDTFDPKPNAPREIRGELACISSNVPGIELTELFPHLAKCADKYAILRGVSHTLAAHEFGSLYMNTGNRPIQSLAYPGYGAVASKELTAERDLPTFVAIPNSPQAPGFLGIEHAALATNSIPQPNKPFTVRGVSLRQGLTVTDVERRRNLLHQLDTAFREFEGDGLVEGLDEFSQQAHAIITSSKSREAFDIAKEKPALVSRFGNHGFGQSCLLACRLVEAGVRFVTISFGGWDMHNNIYQSLKERGKARELDEGLAALLSTLSERGLLDSTTVCATGEFGRTPKINRNAGRDHWPRAMCVLMAGGGIRGGQVIGASNADGSAPEITAITPEQVGASLYASLGIDHMKEYQTVSGRPIQLIRDGSLIPGLFG
jgi:hypothetical protein